jgi:uncharacterized RDD family membrane protein YckC
MKGKKLPSKYLYADFGIRLIAWIVDIVLVLLVTWIIMLALFYRTVILFAFTFHLIAYFIGFLYFFLLETFLNGQTLGKLIFGLKTVDEDTFQTPSMKNCLINILLKCHWLSGLIVNYLLVSTYTFFNSDFYLDYNIID